MENKTEKERLREIVEVAFGAARENFMRDGSCMPCVMAEIDPPDEFRKGTRLVIGMPWSDERMKRAIARDVTEKLRGAGTKRFAFVSEAWTVPLNLNRPGDEKRKEAILNGNVRPSQCADRIEAIIVIGENANGDTMMIQAQIIDSEKRLLGEPEIMGPSKEFKAESNLFPVFR